MCICAWVFGLGLLCVCVCVFISLNSQESARSRCKGGRKEGRVTRRQRKKDRKGSADDHLPRPGAGAVLASLPTDVTSKSCSSSLQQPCASAVPAGGLMIALRPPPPAGRQCVGVTQRTWWLMTSCYRWSGAFLALVGVGWLHRCGSWCA